MKYDVVIGCEVHVQLHTASKAFCRCSNSFGGKPNSRVCPVCMGLPGSLPVTNGAMIERAIIAGLALDCSIAELTKFDRKNYVYPDLPKGYQISQFDMPICVGGYLDISTDTEEARRIRINRLHMEEDAGKNIHPEDGRVCSFVDFNRCGTPLLEIVSEPDMRSAEEASVYVQSIREILRSLDVSDCNMEEGSLRCDANINLWIYEGDEKFATPIAEIKNMNSFRSIRGALEYEEKRQIVEWNEQRLTLNEVGKKTRGYVESRGVTVLQRTKEEASDYRYFPEPDLKPVQISRKYVDRLRKVVGELPTARRGRFIEEYGLPEQDAWNLSSSKALCDYFENAAHGYGNPRKIANLILSEVKKYLNTHGIEIGELKVDPQDLRKLAELVDSGKISGKIAKDVFVDMADSAENAETIVEKKGLSQIADEASISPLIDKVIAENPDSVADFISGTEKAIGFLMGQIMKESNGKANPQMAMNLLRAKLKN
ncbi:MAG: Asp-tRNA(Asn)/Glu-tRNA(Gln) amidotransferase subunit GatB [Spirochaetales bacterium]|jgi:aspartyl-tRNA(Asn)/glutamyl-tRNA(Gln) amidotransferase subunit B|nr:Asp-tRNA(Asn)/Glu-tRNA(Gln) amidotransferase subunit GatB [Spirochaetales bacterium]